MLNQKKNSIPLTPEGNRAEEEYVRERVNPTPETRNPEPESRNPNPETLNPKP
jgi:hypothetical protein